MNITLTCPDIDDRDIALMVKAVRQKNIASGEAVASFERHFSKYIGTVGAIATNSGTSAIILALNTLGVKPGDEVIIPSYTCLALLNAIVQVGAKAILIDNTYEPQKMNYNINSIDIQKKISSKTTAIIVPHMFGVPAAIDEVINCGIPVIEDITLSLGASYQQKILGQWGAISICSFHESKMITCGEGGALTSVHEKYYKRARYLNGWEEEQAPLRLQKTGLPNYELRFNFHLNGISATLGKSQLTRLPEFIRRRQVLAARYSSRLERLDNIICPDLTGENVFFRYIVALKNGDPVNIIREFNKVGIEAGRGVYPALHQYLQKSPEDYPGAEKAISSLVSIPLYPSLSDKDAEKIISFSEKILLESQ